MTDITPAHTADDIAAPAPGVSSGETDDLVATDLIEEVSIDGMCGVY